MIRSLLAPLVTACSFIVPASAQLADIGKKPWLGTFAAHEDRKIQLMVYSTGGLKISPIYDGEARPYNNIPVTYGVTITAPNGRTRFLELVPESLTSEDETTTKLKKTTIKGKVEGDAEFEVIIEQNRSVVSIGGRLISPGKYKPELVDFGVSARVLNFYSRSKKELKNDPKAFSALISQDRLKLKQLDGKKQEHEFEELKTLAVEAINGPGVKEAEVDIKIIKRVFTFEASEDSSFTLSNRPEAALYEGMLVNWAPIREEDPKTESRLSISIK